jgi:hypothetical protein
MGALDVLGDFLANVFSHRRTDGIDPHLRHGLDIVRVEVEPKTAKITLVVKNDDDTESKVNPFDSAPVPEPTRRGRKKKSCA